MPKNEPKYRASPSVNFFKTKVIPFQFYFSKNPIEEIFLNVKKISLENKELKE